MSKCVTTVFYRSSMWPTHVWATSTIWTCLHCRISHLRHVGRCQPCLVEFCSLPLSVPSVAPLLLYLRQWPHTFRRRQKANSSCWRRSTEISCVQKKTREAVEALSGDGGCQWSVPCPLLAQGNMAMMFVLFPHSWFYRRRHAISFLPIITKSYNTMDSLGGWFQTMLDNTLIFVTIRVYKYLNIQNNINDMD